MLFPTVEFAIFFLVILLLAWNCTGYPRLHKAVLLTGSYIFYGFWDWHFLPLLFGLSAYAWLAAQGIAATAQHPKRQRVVLALGIVGCLAALVYYKYVAFLGLFFVNMLLWAGVDVAPDLPSVFLPLGISFMVFHAISLLMDVYRGKLAQPGPLMDTLLYVSFFPQLIAGPILRASSFLPQLRKAPDPARIHVSRGMLWILLGLFKKVVLANALATGAVDEVFAAPALASSTQTLFAVYAYAVQIYCDFSGYTDIAIGCALLLGYHFPANFANPYAATSPQDFWHRWHISLSTWLRDYLFIPLGGSRRGPWRTRFNLLVTMLLGGLWHGAAWTFVAWGGFHGLLLIVHRWWADSLCEASWRQSAWWRWVSRLLLFHAVCFGWILFRASDFDIAWTIFERLGAGVGSLSELQMPLVLALLTGIALQYVPLRTVARLEQAVIRIPPLARGGAVAAVLLLIEVLGPTGVAPFIYFQF